jgi:hypothetical protein
LKVRLRREQCGAHPATDGGIASESGPMEPIRDVSARVAKSCITHHNFSN